MAFFIYPYNAGSRSARALAELLEARIIRTRNSRYRYRPHHKVINWGSHRAAAFPMLNSVGAVDCTSNKISAFRTLKDHEIPTVPFTTASHEAQDWLSDGNVVIARTLTGASGGRGIIVCASELASAPLYTRYCPPQQGEWRLHASPTTVFRAQQKLRRNGRRSEANPYVRNHGEDYVFATRDLDPASTLCEVATAAVRVLGLDFGAVDVVYSDAGPLVLEVNTAPGLDGATAAAYANHFQEVCNA